MIKTIDTANITDEMIEVAAGSAQLRAMAGVTEHDALIRGSILAALIVAPAVESAQSYAEPVAWKHDCAALLTNGVELWIDACPHCGKPRTAAIEPAQAGQSGSCSNLMWATAEMREREHNRIGKMVGVLEQIKQEKLSALEQAQAVPPGYSLQAIAEFDAMNELIRSNDALTIAYMSGKHDQKAIDHGKKQRAIDFVRWVVSLQTGGLIQVRANELLNLLETENE